MLQYSARKVQITLFIVTVTVVTLNIKNVVWQFNPHMDNQDFVFFDATKWSLQNQYIFFIAACDGNETIPAIELCAFESAARHNPTQEVVVILNTHVTMCKPPKYFRHLPNVQFAKIDFSRVFEGSLVEDLWKSQKLHQSKFYYAHTSDMLRLVLLYKFGGTYYDTDIILLKPTPEYDNFMLLWSPDDLETALMKFEKGHPFLTKCLAAIAEQYNAEDYTSNGPVLATNIARQYFCQDRNKSLADQICSDDLTLLGPHHAFNVPTWNWKIFHDSAKYDDVKNSFRNSFAINYWRAIKKRDGDFSIDPTHPLFRIVEDHCPLSTDMGLRRDIGKLYGQKY